MLRCARPIPTALFATARQNGSAHPLCMQHRKPRNHPYALFLGTFAVIFGNAVLFVLILTWSLPPSDGAYGEPPFSDPLVFPIMAMAAGIVSLVVCPFSMLLLQYTRPLASVIVVPVAMWSALVLTIPMVGEYGFVGGFVAMIAAMLFCRRKFPLPETTGQENART